MHVMSSMECLEKRIERLEKQSRRYRTATATFGILGGIFLSMLISMGLAPAQHKTLKAEQFVLVDPKGRPQAVLGTKWQTDSKQPSERSPADFVIKPLPPEAAAQASEAGPIIIGRAEAIELPALALLSEAGEAQSFLFAGALPGLILREPRRKHNASFLILGDGPALALNNGGMAVAGLTVGDGHPSLQLGGADLPTFTVGMTYKWGVFVEERNGKERLFLGTDKGEPRLRFSDAEGKRVFQAP